MNDMTYRPIEHLRTTNHPKIRFPKRRMASVPLIILFISVTTLLISVPLATMVFFMSDRHINHAVRRHTVEKVVKDAAEMKEEPTTFRRGIVMSCPFGPSHTNRGSWKPSNMMRGVDAVLRHLKNVNSSLPLFLGYYASERNHAQKWCEDAVKIYDGMVDIACYEVSTICVFPYASACSDLFIVSLDLTVVLCLDPGGLPKRPLWVCKDLRHSPCPPAAVVMA